MTDVVRDLFDLPAQVRKGDFVLKLSEGVEHPKETAETYVVTEDSPDEGASAPSEVVVES